MLLIISLFFGSIYADRGDIQKMTCDVVKQIRKNNRGFKPWDYKIAVQDLPVQVGSLTKAIMQLHNERRAHGLSQVELKDKIADELADIMSLVLFIAHELNIDIKTAWNSMIKSDNNKIAALSKSLS